MTNNRSGFTLIELLIVIGIIAILAAAVIIAINPGQQFAQARDATRQGHINSLNNAILSYMVSNYGDLSGLNLPSTPTEICANTSTCDGLVNLEPLLTGGHLSAIPIDPSGGTLTNGSGYRIFTYGSDPAIHASKAETRAIQAGNWTFTDPRDGNTYKTVLIGDQLWMAENLRATQYTNGEAIPYVDNTSSGNTTWTELSTGAYAVYDHTLISGIDSEQQMISMYGLLYNGYAANDDRGICPTGWRVSTDTDWKTLEMYLGMTEADANTIGLRNSGDVSKKLKYHLRNPDNQDAGHPRWNYDATHYGIDSVGFSALPGGYRHDSAGVFDSLGTSGYWWSCDGATCYRRHLNSGHSGVFRYTNFERFGVSVRCLKN